MAELILTDEEKAAALWTDLSDEALGKVIKARISNIVDVAAQSDRMTIYAAALLLACAAAEMNAQKMNWNLKGVTQSSRELGDWVVRAELVKTGVAE